MLTMNDRGAKALAAGIVVQAVRDWYCCRDVLLYGIPPNCTWADGRIPDPEGVLDEIERFFTSDWFVVISDLDGQVLLDHMRSGPQLFFRGNAAFARRITHRHRQTVHSWLKLSGFPELQEDLWKLEIDQNTVAAAIGVSSSTLSNWMRIGITGEQADRIQEAADRIKAIRNA